MTLVLPSGVESSPFWLEPAGEVREEKEESLEDSECVLLRRPLAETTRVSERESKRSDGCAVRRSLQ